MKINCTILFLFLISVIGCEIINPEEMVPGVLDIERIDLATTNDQGANTHAIEDIWVTSDGFLGVFPLPAEVPILANGPTNVLVQAGIRPDGRAGVSIPYPHYQIIDVDLDLEPGIKSSLSPTVEYTEGTKFSFIDGFETNLSVFVNDLDTIAGLGISKSADDVRSGSFAGKIVLTEAKPLVIASTEIYTDVLNAVRSIFLEVDYKNEEYLTFQYIYITDSGPRQTEILTLNKKEEWNKIYFDLSDIIPLQSRENIHGISIVVRASLSGEDSATIYLDNLRLIYE